jgi:hypothetical protein
MSVGVMTVGEITVGVMTVGVMRQFRNAMLSFAPHDAKRIRLNECAELPTRTSLI